MGVIGILTIQNSATGFIICGALLLDGVAGILWNIMGTGALAGATEMSRGEGAFKRFLGC